MDEVLQARLGSDFPENGVGKNWINQFVEKHSSRLQTHWSKPLEALWGRAVNPTTLKAWYDMYSDVKERYNIDSNCIYGTDEIGTHSSDGLPQQIIGQKKKGPQYQQWGGNRENITL